jgi:formylglycine-generating enzyme required for sulfatase activity
LSLVLRVREPLGERAARPNELPLGVGGEGAAVAVPGIMEGVVAVRIGADEHGLFAEAPEEAAGLAAIDGRIVRERGRLVHGDVITVGGARIHCRLNGSEALLDVVHLEGNPTQPPIFDSTEREEDAQQGADAHAIQRVPFKPATVSRREPRARPRPQRWALAGILIVLGSALGYLIAATPVRVVVDPPGAEVDFQGGWPEIGFGGTYLLRPGKYTVVASHRGYETAKQAAQVGSARNQQIRIALAKLPGRVTVDTQGIAATLTIDGKPVGPVPGEYPVAAGPRAFEITAPRYLDFKETVEVKGAGEAQTFTAELLPGFSPVTIESKPAGARVTVNGKDVGATPLTTDLDAGSHNVTLTASGFRPWESTLQVQANTPQKIGPVELGLPDGSVTIRSAPAGADVAIGGRYRGRTPLTVALAPGVQHQLMVTRAGYEPAQRTVPVKGGERSSVDVELKPILGEVTVRGEPADARLFVDGEARGAANQTLSLPSAELTLEVRREGFETFTTKVTPQPGFPRVVEYRLQTPEQSRAARVPPTIRAHTGIELKRMPGGTFTMGSSRREPGRRANEVPHAVTLSRTFYLGVREVTNAEYRQFRTEHLSGVVRDRSLDQDNHPVVNISWQEAAEFCNWLSAQDGLPAAYVAQGDTLVPVVPATTGYRLPTEAEWEWAARYDGGRANRRYPWGGSLPVAPRAGNFADRASLAVLETALSDYDDGVPTTAPVGTFPPNPLGLYDMGGNVTEWVQDFYTVSPDLLGAAITDPIGPPSGTRRVVRGSSWRSASIPELRLAWRDYAEGKAQHIGFRIARYADEAASQTRAGQAPASKTP